MKNKNQFGARKGVKSELAKDELGVLPSYSDNLAKRLEVKGKKKDMQRSRALSKQEQYEKIKAMKNVSASFRSWLHDAVKNRGKKLSALI